MLHPIKYSLVLNVLALVLGAGLAYLFDQGLLFIIVVLLLHHSIGRFEDPEPEPEPHDYGDDPRSGFTAKVH